MNTYKSSNTIAMVLVAAGFGCYLSSTDTPLQGVHVFLAVPIGLIVGGVIEALRRSTHGKEQKPDAPVTRASENVKAPSSPKPVSSTANKHSEVRNPKRAWECYLEGNQRNQFGDTGGAITCFSRAIELDPTCWKAYGNRGVLKIILGKYESAIADLDRAIEIEPTDVISLNGRANAKAHLSLFKDAIADITDAIRLEPTDGTLFANRADYKIEIGDYQGAVLDCAECLRLVSMPNRMLAHTVKMGAAMAHRTRAKARRKLGDLKGAAEDEQFGE